MEVTCEHCKAEYDFDDSLVGESGTSVKCTDCGHVFKVYPPNAGGGRGRLQIRFRDGHMELLSSLRELQRRARDGEVTLDDEIGREGYDWRPLRTVPELRGFFEASGSTGSGAGTRPLGGGSLAVTPSLRPGEANAPAAGAKQTMLGMGPASAAQGAPPAAAGRGFDEQAVTTVAGRAQRPQAAPQPQRPAAPRASAPKPAAPSLDPSQPAAVNPPPAQPQAPSAASPKLYLADDDAADMPTARPSAGSGSLRWVGLGVLVAGGVWFGINAMSGRGFPSFAVGANSSEPEIEPAAATADEPSTDGGSGEAGADAAVAPKVEPLETDKEKAAKAKSDRAGKPQEKPQAEKPTRQAEHRKSARARRAARAEREKESERRKEPERDEGGEDYGSLVGRASKALDRGQYGEAEQLLKRALEQRGSGSEANSGMGFALLGQGKPGAAIPFLQKAARNGFAAASVGLGDAYAKMGRRDDAVEAYEAYLQRLPSGSRAGYARQRIEALGPSSPPPAAKPKRPAAPAEPAPAAPSPAAEEEPQPEEEGDDYVPAGALSEDGL